MRIRFDVDYDGYPWPGPLGQRKAVLGEQWLGPVGMLDLLATQLGLTGQFEAEAVRAAALVPATMAISGFWTESARVDPMGVARTLLVWRDELRNGGWRGQGLSPRLTDLARLSDAVLPGVPDRLQSICRRLLDAKTDIGVVELCEPRSSQPHQWKLVFDALERAGTKVVELVPDKVSGDGDLSLAKSGKLAPTADGSLQLLRCQGPQLAAETVAAWLSSQGDLTQTVVVGGCPILDGALQRHGLPAVGSAGGRGHHSLLEVLPLVMHLGWSPPDPARALELLTLPFSPISGMLRRPLIAALKQWPAVESDLWRESLAEGLKRIGNEDDRARHQRRMAELFRPSAQGGQYPAIELHRRATMLMQWLQGMLSADSDAATSAGDPRNGHASPVAIFEPAIRQCSNFMRLLEALRLHEFTRPQLQRLLDDATAQVPVEPPFAAQAGLAAVRRPGAVGGPAERVIWWNFTRATAVQPRALPLTLDEKRLLAAAGVVLPDPGAQTASLHARWSRPLRFARSTLLLVCPKYGEDGEDQHPHPLWDEVAAAASSPSALNRLVVAEPIMARPPRKMSLQLLPAPQPRREWHLPRGVAIARREQESPSSAGALVGCPFQWTLRYAGRIVGGDTAALPADEQLIGTVAHEILARVLKSGVTDPDQGERAALQLFDAEGPRLAAPLFVPGAEQLKQNSRQATGRAAKVILHHLKAAGLSVKQVETEFAGRALDGSFVGRADLVVGSPEVVIDLKWSGEKYRRTEMANGASFQLAAYSHLVGKGKTVPPVAYFILQSQTLLTTSPAVFPHAAVVDGTPPDEIWRAFEQSYRQRIKELSGGLVTAPGDRDDDGHLQPEESALVDGRLQLTPPCRFCDYGLLCGHGLDVDPAVASTGEG